MSTVAQWGKSWSVFRFSFDGCLQHNRLSSRGLLRTTTELFPVSYILFSVYAELVGELAVVHILCIFPCCIAWSNSMTMNWSKSAETTTFLLVFTIYRKFSHSSHRSHLCSILIKATTTYCAWSAFAQLGLWRQLYDCSLHHFTTSQCILKCVHLTFSTTSYWLAEVWNGHFSTPGFGG